MALLTSTLAVIRPSYLMAGVLVAAGTLGADVGVAFVRTNAIDVPFTGSDAVYALVLAGVTYGVGSTLGLGRPVRFLSLGMVAAAALNAKQEFTA